MKESSEYYYQIPHNSFVCANGFLSKAFKLLIILLFLKNV